MAKDEDFYTNKIQKVFNYILNDNSSRFNKEKKIAMGSILGAFLGDSIGSYYEFQKFPEPSDRIILKEESPIFGILPGQVTDDSELALASSFGILDSNGNFNLNKVAFHNAVWTTTQPFDAGNTMRSSLSTINDKPIYQKLNGNYFNYLNKCDVSHDIAMYFPNIYSENIVKKALEKNFNSLSNGFLMRKTPISILSMKLVKHERVELNQDHISDLETFERLHKAECSLTHSNPLALDITVVYGLLVTRLIYIKNHYESLNHKEVIENALNYLNGYVEGLVKRDLNNFFDTYKTGKVIPESDYFKSFKYKYDFLNDLIYQIKEGKSNIIKFSDFNTKSFGYFALALYTVFYYLHKLKNGNFNSFSLYNIMKEIIVLGGDTDTNSCICGGVLGIIFGPSNLIQRDLLNVLLNCNVINSKRKRPIIYSPGFALFFIYAFYKMRERDHDNKKDFLFNDSPKPISAAIFSLLFTIDKIEEIEFDI